MLKIKKLYMASWTATLRSWTRADGLIMVKMEGGNLYVLVSRSRDYEDVVTLTLPLSGNSPATFRGRVIEVINKGEELPFSQARRVFPAEYALLQETLRGK